MRGSAMPGMDRGVWAVELDADDGDSRKIAGDDA